ncbi:MAG: BatD family protein, partial [Verrucomicrobia bacterium]|nr:BatD family protein [Verrucomicrobiota bacterium]
MRFIPKIWYALVAVTLLHGAALAASFTASLDRDSITTGESATLSLSFEGGTPHNVPAPNVLGLQISQVGNSQSYSIINGAMSTTLTVTFSVTSQRPGEYTIPALTAEIGGQQLSTQPLKLTVGKIAAPSADAVNSGNEVVFLKFGFPKQKVYAGESVVAHLDLYLRDEVQNFGNFAITGTTADGFSVGKCVELPNQRHRAQVGNRVYTIIPYAVSATAVKTGSFALGPFTASVVIVLPNGWMGEQRQATLATESANVESVPLPEDNKPAGFNGAIGNFTMTATA